MSEIATAVEPTGQTVATAITPVRKCELDKVFRIPFIDLMKVAPNNLMVRGWIMRLTGKLPPDEENTFEKLKDWIEANVEPKLIQASATTSGGRITRRENAFSISIDFTETEFGRANYRVNNSGSDDFEFTREEVDEAIQDALDEGDSFDELVDRLKGILSDDVYDRTAPDMNSDDYEYSDHNSTDTEDSDYDYETRALKERLADYIRMNHPAAADELL